jgi:hypothetical protein
MADFNQNPLSQTALALSSGTLALGSAAHAATITTDATVYATDHTNNGPTSYAPASVVMPNWRRESKTIAAA